MLPIIKPLKVPKGWGHELWIANNSQYCGKILHVEKGKRCSMHFHVLKHETFYVINGSITMELIYRDGNVEDFIMTKGDVLEIPPGLMHRFTSISPEADIMEVSTEHLDEDSYRVEKGD